jgi:hypothetical protein
MTDGAAAVPRRRLPIAGYGLVFAAAIVVHMWVGTGVHPASMLRPLIVAIALMIVMTAIFTALARSRDLGALAATAVALWLIAATAFPAVGFLLAPMMVLLIVLGLTRRGQPWRLGEQITRAMTFIAAITAIAVGLQAVQSGSFGQAVSDIQLDLAGLGPGGTAQPGAPDIYLVLLDAYPGGDAAALEPGWDASGFGDALRQRGFDVADWTRSNYLQTPQTVASVLDMRYLADNPSLDAPWGPPSLDSYRIRRVINEAQGLVQLHEHGYELTAVASGFAEPELRRVDRFIEPIGINEFELGLLRGTGAGDLLSFVAPDLPAALQRGRIRSSFEALTSEAERASNRPKFVFAHIAAPHPPWVFDAAGNDVPDLLQNYYLDAARDRGIDRTEAVRRHLDQATYVATLTVAAVDRILATAGDSPPVIVVFSDHGPGTGFDQTQPLASDLLERSSNILGVYSPGHPGLFASSTTPVNILPRVLNTYLNTSIPEQADTTFAWRGSRLDMIAVDPAHPHASGSP